MIVGNSLSILFQLNQNPRHLVRLNKEFNPQPNIKCFIWQEINNKPFTAADAHQHKLIKFCIFICRNIKIHNQLFKRSLTVRTLNTLTILFEKEQKYEHFDDDCLISILHLSLFFVVTQENLLSISGKGNRWTGIQTVWRDAGKIQNNGEFLLVCSFILYHALK